MPATPEATRTSTVRRLMAIALVVSALAAACTTPVDEGVEATFVVTPGVETVTVTGARPGQPLTLYDGEGNERVTLLADDRGQAVFTYLPATPAEFATGEGEVPEWTDGTILAPGDGYRIVDDSVSPRQRSEPFRVMAVDDVPDVALYERQQVGEGFGYVEVRDGVELSVNVRFPDEGLWGPPPYPTVIEYSGYSPSKPDGGDPGSMIANLLGFATVGVNLRGTGCSGGTWDPFHPAQRADGYDVVETIARQPWVLGNEVGMIGLSYSGITQLYVAATRPPSLAAITPLSVLRDPWSMQWPGGIYNKGFTRQWLAERQRAAGPGGEDWVQARVEGGDEVCGQNMDLRTQNIEFESFARALVDRPADADGRDLSLLVPEIDVPVYLTGSWQDEQTGPHFATMLDRFTGTDMKRFTLFNGRHPDGYTPMLLTRWFEFLNFYVADRIPRLPDQIRTAAPLVFEQAFGVAGLAFEPDRFAAFTDDQFAEALAAYEAEPEVRVLFEVGAGGAVPGAPVQRFEATFPTWPPPDLDARRWYFGPDGSLLGAQSGDGVDRFEFDPEAGETSYTEVGAHDFLRPIVPANWTDGPPGTSLSYLSERFGDDVVMAGPGFADLWLRSSAPDAHLEVVISIVQPDGTEYFVQHGLLRASARAVDRQRSTSLQVEHDFTAAAREDLPAGEFVSVQVPIYPFAQVFRVGSRLRVQVNTPGRDTPLWLYENPPPPPGTTFDVARTPDRASGVVLPVVRAFPVEVPAGFPPCPSLRGQVCRPFVPSVNRAAG